jgi:hypothetical protein
MSSLNSPKINVTFKIIIELKFKSDLSLNYLIVFFLYIYIYISTIQF